jgi:hypothetical protein
MHTAVEQLNEQVRRVAEARRSLDAMKALYRGKEAQFLEENAHLAEQIAALATVAEQTEGALRALVLAHYEQTKEKKPVPGVEVKEKVALDYDAGAALAWARETKIALLPESLDAKAFEKIAKVTPLAFVKQVVTPQAQIAKDLDAVLDTAADTQVAA